MHRFIQLKQATSLFLIALVLAWIIGFLPKAQALNPPPVGGYPGQNTATGDYALFNLTTGTRNTAIGFWALNTDTTGGKNTAIGFQALADNTIGKNNIAIGYAAGIFTTGDNNINIGNVGAEESDTIRIGTVGGRGIRDFQSHTYIAGISGVTIAGGAPVVIDTDGHLGSTTSSERFKDEIKPMNKASEAILALKPVTFHYKKELDPAGIQQFSLVAGQVEKVNPALVALQCRRESLFRALRRGERDVAKRVPQRASQSAGLGSECRAPAKANRSAYGRFTYGARST